MGRGEVTSHLRHVGPVGPAAGKRERRRAVRVIRFDGWRREERCRDMEEAGNSTGGTNWMRGSCGYQGEKGGSP